MRLFFLFIFLASTTFSASLDEMKQLYQKAELAMKYKNYAEAKEAYTTLLQSNIQPYVDIFTYADISIRLATADARLGNAKEAEKRLKLLLHKPLPDDLFLKAKVLYAKLRQEQNHTEEAFCALKELQEKVPANKWPLEEFTYYLSLEQIVKERYISLAGHAKRLFDASLFVESAALYQEILDGITSGRYPGDDKEQLTSTFTYLLAKAHFESGNYPKVISLLQPGLKEHRNILLLAKAYKEMGNVNEEVSSLQLFLQAPDPTKVPGYDSALFELGQADLKLERNDAAKECFEKLLNNPIHPKTANLARLYLARLHLKEKAPHLAKDHLEQLLSSLAPNDPLKYEVYYLQGEAAFQNDDFAQAIHLFEKSIPKQNKEKAAWVQNARYTMGWSFLKLTTDKNASSSTKLDLFNKAEKSFRETISLCKSKNSMLEEKAILSLGRLFQMKSAMSEQAIKDLEELFAPANLFSSVNHQAEAFLIKADAQPVPEIKAQLYKQLTESAPFNTTLSGKRGWYFRGMQVYQMAEDESSQALYLKAGDLLITAHQELKDIDQETAFLALLYAGKSLYFAHDPRSSSLLDQLVTSDLFKHGKKQDEALYFHALTNEEKAEQSVLQLKEAFPKSSLTDQAIFSLATSYFEEGIYDKAAFYFAMIAQEYKGSSYAPESLFWAAESVEKGEDTEDLASTYRKDLFKEFPTSPKAAEAYFRLYSFAEYLHGDREALQHLQAMKEHFPDSPFLIVATYLVGVQAKSPLLLEETTLIFERFHKENKIPKEHFDYFVSVYYRAKNERSLLMFSLLDQQEGEEKSLTSEQLIKNIKEIAADFQSDHHPLTKKMLAECGYPRLCEENDYLLAKTRSKMGQDDEANAVLDATLKKYEARGTTKGYYLAMSFYEKGQLAMKAHEYTQALEFFNKAKGASSPNLLSVEQKLAIWMDESACHKAMHHYDKAMLMLSYVINENASSSLRIQAMLLRADLYALQGRHELAIKQLEAVTKKGGDFAHTAATRLKEEYGFE